MIIIIMKSMITPECYFIVCNHVVSVGAVKAARLIFVKHA